MSDVFDENICFENEVLRLKNAKLKERLDIAVKALYNVQTWLTCDPEAMKELMPDFCAEQKALETANAAIEKVLNDEENRCVK